MKLIIVILITASVFFALSCAENSAMEIGRTDWKGHQVIQATGEIVPGDAQRFSEALLKVKPLAHGYVVVLLDSPGGSVSESLRISNVFSRFKIHAVIPESQQCASACASVLFIAAAARTIEEGGLLGQHSCADAMTGKMNDTCNGIISKHAVEHGVSYGSVQAFVKYTSPDKMQWFTRQDADCYGITRYPFSTEGGFRNSEPCVFEALGGKARGAQSVWRVDFKTDGGYRAFVRTSADNRRELELNVFCKDQDPEVVYLSMDIQGPHTLVKQAVKSASLEATPVNYRRAKFSIGPAGVGFTRVEIQIGRHDVIKFLRETNELTFTIEVNAPFKPIIATTYLSASREALLFAANACVAASR